MSIDPKALRGAFSRFMTGVTVVTGLTPKGDPVGFTANSFTSVSLDPPLLLVCPGNHLSSFEVFQSATRFGVSILAEGQEEISNMFASSKEDRFAQCDWSCPMGDIPLITGRAAGFVCDTHSSLPMGDHQVLIGQIKYFDQADVPGLGYGPDGYFSQGKERLAQAPGGGPITAGILLEQGQDIFLDTDMTPPLVEVAAGQSPLKAMQAALDARQIEATPDVVYAVYDDAGLGRRIVFRGTVKGVPADMRRLPIAALPKLQIKDAALQSLLSRFAQEHATQRFGFYLGDQDSGDVMPMRER